MWDEIVDEMKLTDDERKYLEEQQEYIMKTVDSIWKIVIDSSSYLFNASHSYAMAHDSLWVAYAKAHYPKQTYIALIKYFTQKRKMDKVRNLIQEASRFFGINVEQRKFGQDNREIHYDGEAIIQSLSTVKHINEDVGKAIYEIRNCKLSGIDLYLKLKEIGLNKTQISVLCKIDYFNDSEKILWLAENFKEISQLKKDSLDKLIGDLENKEKIILALFANATSETAKLLKYDDKSTVFKVLYDNLPTIKIPDLQRYYWQLDLIGSIIGDNQEEYTFYNVEAYREHKGSLLLHNIETDMQEWTMYAKNIKNIKPNDIVAVKFKPQENKGMRKINILFNLTKLYK